MVYSTGQLFILSWERVCVTPTPKINRDKFSSFPENLSSRGFLEPAFLVTLGVLYYSVVHLSDVWKQFCTYGMACTIQHKFAAWEPY